ncbi:hypothetical protein LX32DRAFT_641727 [Colletotrichum zoysiae]|uniref:Uncharacterized protein n=1 Tax=Colletotrichum zoysiae TaxID=1216348 RepID=A0AAD9HE04_9PEZI|nr:hypothetical protein LX32DRAFT_641727 [Colletotrichum zoysiae]
MAKVKSDSAVTVMVVDYIQPEQGGLAEYKHYTPYIKTHLQVQRCCLSCLSVCVLGFTYSYCNIVYLFTW